MEIEIDNIEDNSPGIATHIHSNRRTPTPPETLEGLRSKWR